MRVRAIFRAFVYAVVSLGLLAGSGVAAAQSASAGTTPVASGGYKIGVVSRAEAIKEYNKRKTEYDKLQAEVNRLQKPLDAMADKIKKEKADYDTNKETMSEQDRKDTEDKIQEEFREYKAEMNKNQGKVDDMEKRVLEGLMSDIDKAVKHIAETQNYHLVLEGSTDGPGRSVIYFSNTINITPQVIAYLNQGTEPSSGTTADAKPKPASRSKKDKN